MGELTWHEKEHCLEVDVSSFQIGFRCVRISGWSNHLRWHVEKNNGHIIEGFGLESHGLEMLLDSVHPAAKTWWQTIPEGYRLRLKHLNVHRFSVLRALSFSDFAREFLEHHFLLLLCWLNHCVEHEYDEVGFDSGLMLGKRGVMRLMGFDQGKTASKLLHDFTDQVRCRWHLTEIAVVLQDSETLKNIRHLSGWSFPLLRFVRDFPQLGNSKLLTLFCNSGARSIRAIEHTLHDIERMRGWLGAGLDWRQIRNARSVRQLNEIHDHLVRRTNGDPEPVLNVRFPSSPVAEIPEIEAIKTGQALQDEGRVMGHCVASYLNEIMQERYYVYRVIAPERATVGLQIERRAGEACVRVDQVKGAGNRAVSAALLLQVEQWIRASRRDDRGTTI